MGIKNRERRRKKQIHRQRERHRSEGPGSSQHTHTHTHTHTHGAIPPERLLAALVEAIRRDDIAASTLLGALGSGNTLGGQAGVVACARSALDTEIARCRARGWETSEVQRVTRQLLGSASVPLARGAIRAEWRRAMASASSSTSGSASLRWAAEAQLFSEDEPALDPGSAGWLSDLSAVVALIALLVTLPRLPHISNAASGTTSSRDPGASGSGPRTAQHDEAHRRILERVRGLLAKAEATNFPEEADALTAKAQELLARHSLDRAALDATAAAGACTVVSSRRIWLDDPYVPAKASLLHQVSSANRCRAVLMDSLGMVVVAGHADDLDTVETLFTSLLLQATTQLTAAGAARQAGSRSRSRSFRQSFLVAFATRIGQRLRAAARACEEAAAGEHGMALLPVLASRRNAADEAVEAAFGKLESNRLSASDRLGWAAGTAAADLARLNMHDELSDAARPA